MKVLVAILLVAVVAPTLSAPAPEPVAKPGGGVVLVGNPGVVPVNTLVVGPGGGIVSTSGLVPVSTLGGLGHPALIASPGLVSSPLILG
ncbi:hypothetical protein ONE63_002198 [Megalurothrips usitatus]|uniref:Uncharacterized protein n=1 Tax=Megalurothrips usitatus TaxID=439358 RepID=A0AAV7XEG8_9NEOP|nr:hypothetical protein ONE63_002198 [Megalurothrips usitatus]